MDFKFDEFKTICTELFPDATEFSRRNGAGIIYSAQITVRQKPHILCLMVRPNSDRVNIYSTPPTATAYSFEGAEQQLRDFAKEVKKFG
ncbi:MAG: hypothetical protein WCW31_05380 [Patescibacteria group bacterium]